jgi:hypothetical protein
MMKARLLIHPASGMHRMLLAAMMMAAACGAVHAQRLDARFSCSTERNDGERVIYADNGEIRIDGARIQAFRWESALYRATHGFDCSIDETDGLQLETRQEEGAPRWRVSLQNARRARDQRGFHYDRMLNCTIRLEREGDMLRMKPSCPALCGSRANFSELSVDLKTGTCRYEE